VITGVLGVLAMTSEYSSGLIRVTFAAVPRRSLVLGAKAFIWGLAFLVLGEIAVFASFLLGIAVLRSSVPHPWRSTRCCCCWRPGAGCWSAAMRDRPLPPLWRFPGQIKALQGHEFAAPVTGRTEYFGRLPVGGYRLFGPVQLT
jgi:hypothetical protein